MWRLVVWLFALAVHTVGSSESRCRKGELDLVFPNPEGGIESLTNITYRGLGPIEKAAGLKPQPRRAPRYGIHAFRHAAVSLFIAEGWSPKRIQVMMGHSNIGITFDTYGHLFPTPEDDQTAMRRLQARLLG